MGLKAAPEDQALLLELQTLDTTLQQLARRVDKLPEREIVDRLDSTRTALERTRAEQSGAAEDVRLELKRTEADVEVVQARIVRDTERLNSSASVKDVAAEALRAALPEIRVTVSDLRTDPWDFALV